MKKVFNKITGKTKNKSKNEETKQQQSTTFFNATKDGILYDPIVVDVGTSSVKAGFAGEDSPRFIFPTAAEKHVSHSFSGSVTDVITPIERGIVHDWNAMEDIWYQTFYNKLKINPDNHAFLLTEKAFFSKNNCEKTAELLFEKFNVSRLFFLKAGVATLYASGRTTGITMDCGEGVTQIIPIHEGYAMPHAAQSVNLGGQDVTDYFGELLKERGHSFHIRKNLQVLKEKCSFMEVDYEKLIKSDYPNGSFEIGNGAVIEVGKERFHCAEVLLKPSLININHCLGIIYLLYKSIMESEADTRQSLCNNIILGGGSTMFPGIKERLTKELTSMSLDVKIVAPEERKYSTWIGGSIVASLSTFQPMFITQQDYAENGLKIVGTKCFF